MVIVGCWVVWHGLVRLLGGRKAWFWLGKAAGWSWSLLGLSSARLTGVPSNKSNPSQLPSSTILTPAQG
jgi:hypothetical protein